MNVGDRIRLLSGPACLTLLGVPADQVGTVRIIEPDTAQPSVLISFPDVAIYVSPLRADDVEVVAQAGTIATGRRGG